MRTLFFTIFLLVSLTTNASVSVNVNGSAYTIPQNNEKGWGTAVTSWIQAMSSYTLQPNGGSFTLTADVNFGSTYGVLLPYHTSSTANPATAGVLRLAKTDTINWRNNANGANLPLGIDSSDRLTFNSVLVPTATAASVQDSTFNIYDDGDSSKKIAFQASGITTATTRTVTMPDFNVDLGNLTVAQGGSGRNTLTNHGVLVGAGTSAITQLGAGSAGQILQSGGASADPAYSTPTYPSASGSVGKFLRSDGTNNVYTTMTHPDTAVAGSILNASSANVLAATVTPVLGVAGSSTGTIGLSGVTSGLITIQPQSAAGTYNLNLPITAGNPGQTLTSQGGGSSAMTWTSPLTNPMTTAGDTIVSSDGSGTAARAASGQINNCSLAVSVAASAMTIALKDAAGNDPSATTPCVIPFRSATAATGTMTPVLATAATSVVAANGDSIGCATAAVQCVIQVYAINNAGTIVLGMMVGGALDEGSVQSSSALTGGADIASSTLWSTAAQASKAVRLIGRVTITPAAAFAWTNAVTEISMFPFAKIPWYVNVTIAGGNPSLGVVGVSAYTEITNASLTMTPISGSAPAGVMCSTTNAATAPSTSTTTCAAGSESLGANFAIPEAGIYQACVQGTYEGQVNTGVRVDAALEVIETPTAAQTLTLEGGGRVVMGDAFTVTGGTNMIMDTPFNVCGIFNWTSAAAGTVKGIRLMYEQTVTGTPGGSLILSDGSTDPGQYVTHIFVRKL